MSFPEHLKDPIVEITRTDIHRMFKLPDLWLAAELLRLARQARQVAPDLLGNRDASGHDVGLVWDIIPEVARRPRKTKCLNSSSSKCVRLNPHRQSQTGRIRHPSSGREWSPSRRLRCWRASRKGFWVQQSDEGIMQIRTAFHRNVIITLHAVLGVADFIRQAEAYQVGRHSFEEGFVGVDETIGLLIPTFWFEASFHRHIAIDHR